MNKDIIFLFNPIFPNTGNNNKKHSPLEDAISFFVIDGPQSIDESEFIDLENDLNITITPLPTIPDAVYRLTIHVYAGDASGSSWENFVIVR